MNIKNEAAIKRLGLISGFYLISDIASWAEKIIMENDSIDELKMYDVAGGGNLSVNDMSSLLKDIESSSLDQDEILSELFSCFLASAETSVSDARVVANCLFNLSSLLDGGELTSFRDQYEDIDLEIYGTEDEVRKNLIKYLEKRIEELKLISKRNN